MAFPIYFLHNFYCSELFRVIYLKQAMKTKFKFGSAVFLGFLIYCQIKNVKKAKKIDKLSMQHPLMNSY